MSAGTLPRGGEQPDAELRQAARQQRHGAGSEPGRSLRAGTAFSGIEGFGLGLNWAGVSVLWHIENDEACRRVIQRHWAGLVGKWSGPAASGGRQSSEQAEPPSRLYGDIATVHGYDLAPVDVVVGGFPCQDLSVAGKRAGLAGERSGLWFQFHRLLAELAPRWVVIENVPGLLSSNGGRDMAVILRGLAELGYGWAYRVLDAQYFGVAQRRRRVFIVGCLGDWSAAAQVLFEPESCDGDSPPSRAPRKGLAATLSSGSGVGSNDPGRRREDDVNLVPDVAWALQERDAKGSDSSTKEGHLFVAHSLTTRSAVEEDGTGRGTPIIPIGMAVRRLTPTECERLQGFPDGWTEGESDSARYRMLGNAVAVPVVEWIARRIVHVNG